MTNKNILFLLSGSIACFKACEVISALVKRSCQVQTAVTQNALKFIGVATLQGLTNRSVYTDMFGPRQQGTEHIHLNQWADITVVCPASANVIGKMANGIADDEVSTLLLSHDFQKPCLLVPAMNTNMYHHPATQQSLEKLKSWGVHVMACRRGRLACGVEGEGRMPEPADVLAAIEELVK